MLSGPAGTGKSRADLEKIHLCALKYAGMRALLCRKTLASLTGTGLVTFNERVQPQDDGVRFFGGSAQKPAQYVYPNGSALVVGGLDKASKVMSSEYDMIWVQEVTEASENDWESLDTRLRNNVMPYQQLLGDCNPGPPTHWLKLRSDAGKTTMLESRHEDNPSITPEYLAALDNLTGVRYLRLRLGIWAAAEGLVYEDFDTELHLLDRRPIPLDWPRYWSVDFGFTNPFVWQCWAVDPDGRVYLYREIYKTQTLVEDHARHILTLTKEEPKPRAIICDHDAEDRATLERHLRLSTVAAEKAVSPGIQAVQQRLRKAGDGKARLFLLRDSLAERDEALAARTHPLCTDQEFGSYAWAKAVDGRPLKEQPVKEYDHGMDALRYFVSHLDLKARSFRIIG